MQNSEQNSLGWFRARIGNITGSEVGDLVTKPRSKTERWSETAKSYLYKIAFQRCMNPDIINDDILFQEYLDATQVRSKAITWGHEYEDSAAQLFAEQFAEIFHPGEEQQLMPVLTTPSSVRCEEKGLRRFASSPDRLFDDPYTNELCAVEIKCPQENFAKFARDIFLEPNYEGALEALRKLNAKYFWQCHAHMLATGATKTFFVIYNPMLLRPIHALCIQRDEETLNELRTTIKDAEEWLNEHWI